MQRAALAALGSLLLTSVAAAPIAAAAADAKAPAAQSYKAPRNAFGQPDLSGYWSNATLTPMARRPQFKDQLNYTPEQVKEMESNAAAEVEEGNEDTDPDAPAEAPKREANANVRPEFAAAGGDVGGYNRGWLDPGSHVMRVNGEPRTSLITTPNGLPPARKAGAPPAPRFGGGGAFDSYENRSLGERCIMSFGRNAGPPMFPNGFYNNNYQIVQTKDAVLIEVEMIHDLRIIPLNAKHRTDGVRPYMGDSIGWWEGDTLVIETINMRPEQGVRGGSSDRAKVTEWLTRIGPNKIRYRFTIDDPGSYAAPVTGEVAFNATKGPVYEYACHEGNYAMEGILAGARESERTGQAAAATASDEGGN